MKDLNYFQQSKSVDILFAEQLQFLDNVEFDEEVLISCIRICQNAFYPELSLNLKKSLPSILYDKRDKIAIFGKKLFVKESTYQERQLLRRIFERQPLIYLHGLLTFPSKFISQSPVLKVSTNTTSQQRTKKLIAIYDKISTIYRDCLRKKGILSPGLLAFDCFIEYAAFSKLNEDLFDFLKYYQSATSLLLDSYFGDLLGSFSFSEDDKFHLVHYLANRLVNYNISILDLDLLSKLIDIIVNLIYPDLRLMSEQYLIQLLNMDYLILDQVPYCFPVRESDIIKFKRIIKLEFEFLLKFGWVNNHQLFDECRDDQVRCLKKAVNIYHTISVAYTTFLQELEIKSPVIFSYGSDSGEKKFFDHIYNNYSLLEDLMSHYNMRYFVRTFLDVNNDLIEAHFERNPLEDIGLTIQ